MDYALSKNKKFHLTLVDLNTYDLNSKDEVETSISKISKLFPYPSSYISINPALMHNSFDGALVTFSSSAQLEKQKYNLCHHPWIEFVIDYKGNAVGCCRDLRSEYILGNVLEENKSLDEIWNGPKMRHLRQQLAKKSPESINTCQKCDLPYGTSYAGSGHYKKLFRYLKR